MANSNDMFDDILSKKESFFIPSDTEKKTSVAPNVRGEFYGHLKNATQKEVSFSRDGSTYKAIVYNYDFEVSKENKSQSHTYKSYKDNTEQVASGEDYIGRTYKGNGIFRFLEPGEGDKFDSNATGNQSYLRFCETLKVEIPKKIIEMNGESVEVQALPSLDSPQINGKPAIAVVDKGKPYEWKGKERTPYVVKFIKVWADGEVSNDIPF